MRLHYDEQICGRRFAGFVFCAALTACAAVGCGGSAPTAGSSAPSSPSSAATPAAGQKRYHMEGTIISVDKAQQSVVVNHKEIPGFMGAMAMPYPVAKVDAKMLDQLAPGDQITADVVVADGGASLENIVIVKKGHGAAASPTALEQSPAGEEVPAFTLLNEEGKKIDLRQYQGKALLITFIYTRCPLPDYCPLMTHNFASIEKSLAQNPELYAKTHLLSISFDPKFDTPAILRQYARSYGQTRFDHWEFAALPLGETRDASKFFNIFVSEEGGQINHSMSTAILSPQGTLYRSYSGNDWKPADVLADLTVAASLRTAGRSITAAAR